MNVTIEIQYKAASRIIQSSSFSLRGRTPAYVALQWWKQIKNEMSYHAQLEKVIVDGEHDITQQVIELEKQEWKKALNDESPF